MNTNNTVNLSSKVEQGNILMMEEAIRQFETYMIASGFSKHTIRHYIADLHRLHAYLAGSVFNGEYAVLEIKRKHLEEYLVYLKDVRGNADQTRDAVLTSIKSFLNYLLDNDYVEKNVAKPIIIKAPIRERDFLTQSEIKDFISKIDHPVLYGVIWTILLAGLRVSEVVQLNVQDVDLTERMLFIRQAKGKKDRMIPISKTLFQILSDYENIAMENRTSYFATYQTLSISEQYINKKIKQYREAAGIEKRVSAHVLRHSFGSMLANQNCPVQIIQRLLGHSNIRTTSIYLHTSKSEMKQAVDLLNDMLEK